MQTKGRRLKARQDEEGVDCVHNVNRGVVTLLRSCVQEGGDSVVTACGLAQGAAGGVHCTRVQGAGVASGAGDGLGGPGASQAEADRVNVLVGLQGRAVAWIEPPQPRVVHVRVAELSKASACSPGSPHPSCICNRPSRTPASMCAVMIALDLGALARVRVLFIAVAVIRRDAPGVARS